MGFLGSLLGIFGFGIGIPIGMLMGFFLFVYSKPKEVKDPVVGHVHELDTNDLIELLPEIPLWVKNPDYERVNWLNKFLSDMWPYLDKAICNMIRDMAQPIFAEYVGKYQIEAIEFQNLTLGTIPPAVQVSERLAMDAAEAKTFVAVMLLLNGNHSTEIEIDFIAEASFIYDPANEVNYSCINWTCPYSLDKCLIGGICIKMYETNEKDLVIEPALRWAGNPNVVLALKMFRFNLTFQLVDLQVSAAPRIALRPLVPTFPCFANIVVSLMKKPRVDFGLYMLGGDVMSVPGLYQIVQKNISKQVASLYIWPRTLEIPVLDSSAVCSKKPVGILHVKVVKALKLLKMDILGTSDPYVKLSLTGDQWHVAKKTAIRKKNLNPVWNEKFKFLVKDPNTQVLLLDVYDWDKVGGHDKLGMQFVPLNLLKPYEMKELTLDLLKSTSINDSQQIKHRGQIVVELTFIPFKEEGASGYERMDSGTDNITSDAAISEAGLLSVMVHGAENVEGERHTNPYAVIVFRGEKRKTMMIKKTRNPLWNEEFQFVLEEPPINEKILIEVLSKPRRISFRSKESLGQLEINLTDVIHNRRINQKYHLINSKNGKIHVEIGWKTI